MITSEKLKATKIVLTDEEGKSTFYVYNKTAKQVMESLGASLPTEKAQPKRRGRKPKAEAATPAAAAA